MVLHLKPSCKLVNEYFGTFSICYRRYTISTATQHKFDEGFKIDGKIAVYLGVYSVSSDVQYLGNSFYLISYGCQTMRCMQTS